MSAYPKAVYTRTAACSECLFGQQYTGGLLTCHAEPPARDSARAPGKALWPIVDSDAWCGSWLPRKPVGSV